MAKKVRSQKIEGFDHYPDRAHSSFAVHFAKLRKNVFNDRVNHLAAVERYLSTLKELKKRGVRIDAANAYMLLHEENRI
jgi:hypothetical protein